MIRRRRNVTTRHTLFDPKVWEALEALPHLYSTDGKAGDMPAVKLFDPAGQAFWVLWEYDPDDKMGFGLCDLGLGFPEIGSVSLVELRALKSVLPIERDMMVETRFDGYKSRNLPVPGYLQ